MSNRLDIGQKVKWGSDQINISGVVLEDKGDEVDCVTHFVAGKIYNQVVTVKKNLLIII